MRLSSLTCIGFEVNAVLSECPDVDLSFGMVHEAAQEHRLVRLLDKHLKEDADLSLLIMQADELAEVESALANAAEALVGREKRKVGVVNSGLFLVIALVLEAIQQNFR